MPDVSARPYECRILGHAGENEREREGARLAECKRVRIFDVERTIIYIHEWRIAR